MENRALTPFPQLTFSALESGKLLDSLDLHLADHFPFREFLVSMATELKNNKGLRDEKVRLYTFDDAPELKKKKKSPGSADDYFDESVDSDSTTFDPQDSLIFDPHKLRTVKGILIYDGMAIQRFSGSTGASRRYLSLMENIRSKVDPSINIYSIIVPTHAEYYLPAESRPGGLTESEVATYIDANLPAGVKAVNIMERLRAHRNEYIFYYTDHHWSGLGAYYAYEGFCESIGLSPVPLRNMAARTNGRFLGSLYKITQDPTLKQKGDTMVLNYPTAKVIGTELNANLSKKSAAKLVYESTGNYVAYLGGDKPCLRFQTENKNGRKILVVKNSFGNPFSVYLVSHFEEVFVIDYRYFKGSALKLVRDFGITDIVFPQPAIFALSHGHLNFIQSIFSRDAGTIKQDVAKKDGNPKKDLGVKKITNKDTLPTIRKDSLK
ncbi:MAG: DHHW family protein [Bacteroidia bacterium]